MKKVVILGSTGSVGGKALEVLSAHKDEFQVVGLGANHNFKLLLEQARMFNVKKISIRDLSAVPESIFNNYDGIEILTGKDGLLKILDQAVDLLILSISGTDAIYPLLYAIQKNIDVALANKEAIIAVGELIYQNLEKSKSKIIPLDSEHNAIYQIIFKFGQEEVSNIFLTCSGGPFLNYPEEELEKVTPQMALSHPKWKMGKKIAVDSATLMNKGFEIIEAHYIFKMPPSKIKVLIHPQALIHGMVELRDGTIIAELAPADMKISISYALGYPERLDTGLRINWEKIKNLTFEVPAESKFPALKIANRCLKLKKSYPAYLTKIDEILVNEFLKSKIKFIEILPLIQEALELHQSFEIKDLNSVENAFEDACEISHKLLSRGILK